ncbi:hypothetical protein Mgra_00002711 [Meloidogyne graminicola]|uniref:Uncharacterized protein n=1 Tax=Meloidogyne graminicola TaxID=189291 RepID=A0A8S9ZXF6_9BILA|nr:hypothetical protein Mgra_00002711 [Meloidogyne graminicola]
MGTVPSSFFGYQQKTAVQPICIDQNSGQIHQLNRDDQPIAIRRRLNSALECVGGRLKNYQHQPIIEEEKQQNLQTLVEASEENLDQTTSTLEQNKCDDNNDVEILINVKNEENKSDFVENKNITLELISQQPSTSFLPKLSPIRNRLWTAPILEDKKIIQQQQQHCKAIFKSARGIKKEIPSLLIDLDSICFNEDLIDKKEENEEKI